MKVTRILLAVSLCVLSASAVSGMRGRAADAIDHRIVATMRTGTMEKELNEGAAAGFRFQAVMGGETAMGGKEVVAVMSRPTGGYAARFQYKLLATNKTGTMQKEVQDAAEMGYEYRGQTVFESAFGGKEVVVILERDKESRTAASYTYKLLATTKTSTMEKELKAIGEQGYEVVGMTVGQTAMGGKELVTITRKRISQ
jgi:hypothetical protein